MSMTMEQVVAQLQQKLFILRDRVAAESGLIDVEGLGRPKDVCGKEKDFQQWSKKTEAIFAGVIKESEMMLEWAAEQTTEITTTAIDLEFPPTDTSADQGVQTWSLCCSKCIHRSWPSRFMKRMTLSPTRKTIRWRHGGDCRSDVVR